MTAATGTAVWWRSPAGYLSVLLPGTVVMNVAFLLLPDDAGPALEGMVVLTWAAAVILLWAACATPVRLATGWLGGFLLAYLAIWAFQVTMGALRGESLTAVALLVPFILLAVATKPPSGADAARVADVLGWTVVVAAVLSLGLELAGVVPPWDGQPLGTPNLGERSAYWLPLADLLGLNGRWVGPWVHPSLAGPWGAYLVVWGVGRRPATAYPFLVVGFAVLLLSASRTSLVGTIAGVAVAWAFHRRSARHAVVGVTAVALFLAPRVLALGGGPESPSGADAVADLTMTGRTGIWPTMLDLWAGAPWLGVGDGGIREAIASGRLPDWAIQAHDVLLDAGVRTGLPGFLLAGTVFVTAAVVVVGAARAGRSPGLALLVAVFVTGLADLTIRWTELYTGTVILLVAVLVSAPERSGVSAEASPPGPRGPGHERMPVREQGTGPDPGRGPTP